MLSICVVKIVASVMTLRVERSRWLQLACLVVAFQMAVILDKENDNANHNDGDGGNHRDDNVPRELCDFDLVSCFQNR